MSNNTQFALVLKSGDAAVAENPRGEIARILRKVAGQIEEGRDYGPVHDLNGNKIGEFDLDLVS